MAANVLAAKVNVSPGAITILKSRRCSLEAFAFCITAEYTRSPLVIAVPTISVSIIEEVASTSTKDGVVIVAFWNNSIIQIPLPSVPTLILFNIASEAEPQKLETYFDRV